MDFPDVKGWVPLRGLKEEIKEKLKAVEEKNEDKVEIPKNWKPEPFKVEDNPHKRLFAVSEFKVLYPAALDGYLKEVFPIVQNTLQEYFIRAELNRLDAEMLVRTTPKTFDPFIIMKAHSVIRLLARFVPVEQSLELMNEDIYEDIVSTGHPKKDVYLRRRQRIDKAEIIELFKEILDVRLFVSGKSIAVIGSFESLSKARKIITDCFQRNIHPIYHLKRYQIINKLQTIPELAGEDWSKYLPPIPKKNVKTKVPKKITEKKEYTPFPNPQPLSKIDKELESGVFHLKYKMNSRNQFKPIDKLDKGNNDNEEPPKKKHKRSE